MNQVQYALLNLTSQQLSQVATKLLVGEKSKSIRENLDKLIAGHMTCLNMELQFLPATFQYVEATHRYGLAEYISFVYTNQQVTDVFNKITGL